MVSTYFVFKQLMFQLFYYIRIIIWVSFKIDLIQFNISELVENYDFIKPDDKSLAPGNFFTNCNKVFLPLANKSLDVLVYYVDNTYLLFCGLLFIILYKYV